MKKSSSLVFMVLSFCVAASACSVEPVPDVDASVEARANADLALDDYFACSAERSGDCSDEEEELVTALEDLEPAVDDIVFRTSTVADCGNGTTVTCTGASCLAEDGLGCACSTSGRLVSIKECPTLGSP